MSFNRFTRARALFGKVFIGPLPGSAGATGGETKAGAMFVLNNTVARTDTAAKNLFVVPHGAIIDELVIFSPAASDAGTTATLSVGKTGTNTFFVNARDVKTASTGLGQQVPAAVQLAGAGTRGAQAADLQIVGIYAETGTASTTGGPWTVTMLCHYDA